MTTAHLLREILEQPEALRRVYQAYIAEPHALYAAADLLRRSHPIYMAGMATSEYAGYPASSLLNQAGKVNFVYDASELLYYHLSTLQSGSSLVLVSQSGESAEIVHMLDKIKGKVPVIGIYNNEASYLAYHCNVGLPIYAGPQLACGTKTNLCSIAVLLLLAEAAQGRDLDQASQHILALADSIQRLLDGWKGKLSPATDFLEGSAYTVFLGRGPGKASALFTSTLFREVPKIVSEGLGAASFRHGLREMIRPEHRVVIFAPAGETHELLIRLAEDMLRIGVPVMAVTNQPVALQPNELCFVIQTEAHDEYWAPILDMVPLQLVGYLLALRKGLEPGRLVISSYVTTQE